MRNGEDWTEETAREAESALGYVFKDKQLLKTCFTHKSYSNAFGGDNNERLEFLGDAVLQLYVSETLFRASKEDEGKLTDRRKNYVSKEALNGAEKALDLMRFLRLSGKAENVGDKTPSSLFEAVTAGIYLDGGIEEVKLFLQKNLSETKTLNYKSLLQELVQEREKRTPDYSVTEVDGGYLCTARALQNSAQGRGKSKSEAETEAAQKLYLILAKRARD